jgi:putative hydrolase of the HAD superfamily
VGSETAIHNIIFDLGGVLLNLDYSKTISHMTQIVGTKVFDRHHQYEFIDQFEMGLITPDEFRTEIRALAKAGGYTRDIQDDTIDQAWNAMILDLPMERLTWLKKVSEKKRIFLLSNTNAIHKACFDKVAEKTLGSMQAFDALFESAYYSHLIHLRKPNTEIFRYVIDRHGLDAKHTLFIDDTAGHLVGAEMAGLQTKLLTSDITQLSF